MKPDNSFRSRARILPSSTSDVQAAIAAIQAKSAALRRNQQRTQLSDQFPDSRVDTSINQSFNDTRNSIDDSTISSDDESDQFLDEIANVIDHVVGKGEKITLENDDDDDDSEDSSSLSSDDDDSSDDSFIDSSFLANGMVSKATTMNIEAFIDSLNTKQNTSEKQNNEIDTYPSPEEEEVKPDHNQTFEEDREEISTDVQKSNSELDDVEQLRVTCSQYFLEYDQAKLEVYIHRATELGIGAQSDRRESDVIALERLLFYTRKEKLPIIPVIDAFENELRESDESSTITRFIYYVREAVHLLETDSLTNDLSSELLSAAMAENVDVSLIKDILKNPKKHVAFQVFSEQEMTPSVESQSVIEEEEEEEEEADWCTHPDFSQDEHPTSMGSATKTPVVEMPEPSNSMDNDSKKSSSFDSHEQHAGKSYDVQHGLSYFKTKMEILAKMDAQYFTDIENPEKIPYLGGVAASKKMLSVTPFKQHPSITPYRTHQWKLSTSQRSTQHPGYYGVDTKSLLNIAVQVGVKHNFDYFEWDKVDLEFSTKRRLIASRNWFGKIHPVKLNKRINHSTSQPSMLVMKRLVYPKQWEEEWYTTWVTRKQALEVPQDNIPNNLRKVNSLESEQSEGENFRFGVSRSEEETYDTSIGKIITMRYRPGERMTKVHYSHTSFLFKSRWKQKYSPKDIFSF